MSFLLSFLRKQIFGFKSRKRAFILIGLFLSLIVIFVVIFWSKDFNRPGGVQYGVTFSKIYAEELSLDWQEAFVAILDELKVDRVRIPIYWPDIEPRIDEFDFADYDWMFEQAQLRGVGIIPVVGRRVPRWPECHTPGWVNNLRSDQAVERRLLIMVEQVTRHYSSYNNVIAWQVENEPFLAFFGECPKPNAELLDKEIAIVKSIDPNRDVIVTDSGELSFWDTVTERGDILGITLYRLVWSPFVGYFGHLYPPAFYRYRANNVISDHQNINNVIIMELQAEPWVNGRSITEATLAEQYRSMDLDRLKNTIAYTERVGFKDAYFWGVEWWYWLKIRHGNDQFWEFAKTIWR